VPQHRGAVRPRQLYPSSRSRKNMKCSHRSYKLTRKHISSRFRHTCALALRGMIPPVNEDAIKNLFVDLLNSGPPNNGRQSPTRAALERQRSLIKRTLNQGWTAPQLARALKNAGAKESVGTLQRHIKAVASPTDSHQSKARKAREIPTISGNEPAESEEQNQINEPAN
jgi:hypothetical protein